MLDITLMLEVPSGSLQSDAGTGKHTIKIQSANFCNRNRPRPWSPEKEWSNDCYIMYDTTTVSSQQKLESRTNFTKYYIFNETKHFYSLVLFLPLCIVDFTFICYIYI